MPLVPGTRLGPYEILALIGEGGMGEVYRATDTRLGRTVAIKTLNSGHMERFEREARAIAALNHPHICALYDVGPDYLVMEYVDGVPLKGPLPLADVLRYAPQIAEALEAAHAKGIIHRDLKPGNILIAASGAKLLDFGLARLDNPADPDATQSVDGVIIGTVAYMSPEQAQGQPVDPRSDIFSFGLVLYEMLTGRKAFPADTAVATLAAILHKEPAPFDAAPALHNIVMRCLRKSPADRFQSAAELRAAFDQSASVEPTEKQPSIAVLPFANMSRDADDEYFSDGLAEEIINALTQVEGLKVIARTSAFAFKGKNEDIRKIAETLGVTNILEGSVRRSGSRIRVTAQLILAADGSHLWSQRYDREMTDVFAIQDEISVAIADQLQVRLTGRKQTTTNVAAYDAVLEGRHYMLKFTPANLARARQCFDRAIALDPAYAPAHAALAEYHISLATVGTADPRQALPQAKEAARRALELDPASTEAHAVLGQVAAEFEYNWADSERHFERALTLNPAAAHVHFAYAYWCLRPTGRLDEALLKTERALELDPLSLYFRFGKAYMLLYIGQDEAAAAAAQLTFDLDTNYFLGLFILSFVRTRQRRFDEAIAHAERAIAVHGRWAMSLLVLGMVYAQAGRRQDAECVREELEQLTAKAYSSAGTIAILYGYLGQADQAFAWAAKAIEQRDPQILSLKTSPAYDSFRSDPRYPTLLEKMNLA